MQKSKIEWCTHTWNPVTGCLHGCDYCYAKRIANRFKPKGLGEEDLEGCFSSNYYTPFPHGFAPTLYLNRLEEPQKLKKPSRIFVSSMGDLFGEWVPDEWIKKVFEACWDAPQHTYLFLTKNPARYKSIYYESPENSLLGTTITCQDDLKKLGNGISPYVDFLSIEPLFGDIDLSRYLKYPICKHWNREGNPNEYGKYWWEKQALVSIGWQGVSWVIIGQQTGPGAKPPKDEWVQSIIDQCRAAEVPVFVKSPLYERFPIQKYPKETEVQNNE